MLSGTGSDGANGVRAVKAHGGVTFAQDPSSAKYESMPRAAMMIGGADLILAPKEIAGKLGLMARGQDLHLEMTGQVDANASAFQTVIQHVRRHTGIDFSKYKETTLRRRIARRMSALKIRVLNDYVAHIDEHREEIDALAKSFMISVTSFFRDKEAFAAIEAVLDKLIAEKKSGDTLRIWVPACATGEEAYSIALLLAKSHPGPPHQPPRPDLRHRHRRALHHPGAAGRVQRRLGGPSRPHPGPQLFRQDRAGVPHRQVGTRHGDVLAP